MQQLIDESQFASNFTDNILQAFRLVVPTIHAATANLAPPKRRKASDRVNRYAAVLDASFFEMSRMITNLTDVGALSAHGLLHTANYDIVAVCKSLHAEALPFFKKQNISLRFDCNLDSLTIALHRDYFERMLWHLLSNSMKACCYGCTVTMKLATGDLYVYLSVADTGRGMSQADLENVFNVCFSEYNPEARARRGIGLGLPICRYIAQKHGGTIVLESTESEGTTVTVSLPKVQSGNISHELPHNAYAPFFGLADALPVQAFKVH